MTNIKRRFYLLVLLLFFIAIPFLQSIIFSSSTQGSIEINKPVTANFIQTDKKIVLLFFGYVGCSDVCTPILQELNALCNSKEFQKIQNRVEILFVNLTPQVRKYQPDLFAKFFNENFKGVYLSRSQTLNIDRNFGVFFSKNLSEETELNHTDHIYLVENSPNRKVLKKIYTTHPLNKIKIINDIMTIKEDEKGYK